jgi:hypothetical protein
VKRCERSEGRDVLVVVGRCHDAMTKRGAAKEGRIQGEKWSYSQEGKIIKTRKDGVAEKWRPIVLHATFIFPQALIGCKRIAMTAR